METNWYEHFFHGLALQFWRNAVSSEMTISECDFIQGELDVSPGSKLLDVPCGNARHSVEFAKRGYLMTAVDLSAEFIAEASESCLRSDVRIELHQIDMRNLSFGEEFDGALCFGNSFAYMKHGDNASFLYRIHGALRRGAKFVIETGLAAESVLPSLQLRRWHLAGDVIALSENHYDASESRLSTEYTFIRSGQIETNTAVYLVYTVGELKKLLTTCGFAVESLYATTRRDPYSLGSPRLLLTAIRI